MPSLADVAQQMGPSITYNERTNRFHDMEQNYRMVSTRGVVAGSPARADGRASSGYVTQESFNSFRSEIYLYISKVASFTREALVEMQKTMAGEQKDTESLRNDEQRAAEERRERRRELVRGALTRVSSGIRRATGMGPLGVLFTGLFASLTAVLANIDIEKLRETFNSIGAVFDTVKEFFDKLKEYSNIILAIGAALAAMVLANMLDRTPRLRPPGGRPPGGGGPAKPPGGGTGPAKPPGGGGPAKPPGGGTGPAKPPGAGSAPIAETDKSGKTKFRDPNTGRYTKAQPGAGGPDPPPRPAKPPAPGTPTSAPPDGRPPGAPEPTNKPRGNRMERAARLFARLSGPLAVAFEAISAREQIIELSEKRDKEEIDDEAYKKGVIDVVAGALGAIGGGVAGAALGAAIGSIVPGVGTAIGGIIGGLYGAIRGAEAGQWFVSTGIGEQLASVLYDTFFTESPTNQPAAELMGRLARLRNERRQRILDDDEMMNTTQQAVDEGRITRVQADQINEIGSQAGTVRRAGDIEAAIEAISASGLEGANSRLIAGREDRTGRVIVLPPIYQESIKPNTRQNQPAPPPAGNPPRIQTRNSDNTLGDAYNGAGFMTAAF